MGSDKRVKTKQQGLRFLEVKDSGKRQEFGTGSVRDIPDGKGRFDLIPPTALRRLAIHYENGSRKYGDWNWLLGQPLSRYLNSAERHLCAIKEGLVDEDHVSAVSWNMFSFLTTQKLILEGQLPNELNDLVFTVEDARRQRESKICTGKI